MERGGCEQLLLPRKLLRDWAVRAVASARGVVSRRNVCVCGARLAGLGAGETRGSGDPVCRFFPVWFARFFVALDPVDGYASSHRIWVGCGGLSRLTGLGSGRVEPLGLGTEGGATCLPIVLPFRIGWCARCDGFA